MVKLYLAMPGYRGGIHNADAVAMLLTQHRDWDIIYQNTNQSLLTYNFNLMWADALNKRDEGRVTHFLMLHTDVQPKIPDWAGVLMREMDRFHADVMSAVIPIKNTDGMT